MRIVRLEAENFKRLEAVEITPEGDLITIGGDNGQGKSSVLDAIWVALEGLSVAPPKPIRDGEQKATISLDLGELVITRTFTQKEGEKITHTLKVEDSEGRRYPSPQAMLDDLLGEIGFDPFDFILNKPEKQAEILMELVPLTVDLDELAAQDSSNYAKRTEINRDVHALESQLAAIPKEEIPGKIPDREALLEQLGRAADTNTAISREQQRREQEAGTIFIAREKGAGLEREAVQLRSKADQLEAESRQIFADVEQRQAALDKLAAVDDFVDTDALREALREADAVAEKVRLADQRAEIEARLGNERAKSQALTDALKANDDARQKALTEAEMPIEGLGFEINDKGKPIVTYQGLPFDKDQISTAAALRVSTAIAMAANPRLRVLRIKDGSLLDGRSMKLLAEMADLQDYQLFIEVVSSGEGVGIVMEQGRIIGGTMSGRATETEVDAKEENSDPNPEGKPITLNERQYVTAKFSPEDERTYTYHNDDEPVACGDQVSVPTGKDGAGKPRTVTVHEIGVPKPEFETRAIIGLAPAKTEGEIK